MAILSKHLAYYKQIFKISNFLREPIVTMGYQDVFLDKNIKDNHFNFLTLEDVFLSFGLSDFSAIDIFDQRASLKYDLNKPVPKNEHNKYNLVFDLGTIEHIFDTRQCIENYFKMTKVGGMLFIHTCVSGYFRHGMHVFNPALLLQAMLLNNFEIKYFKYSTVDGALRKKVNQREDTLIWLVGLKKKNLKNMRIPQQSWEKINRISSKRAKTKK